MVKSHIIYLIGFMGSGKSTAGNKLASLLGWSFLDLDSEVERRAGKTISEIFSQNGEDFFRKLETEVLRDLKSHTDTVISTGGGTPCHSENMNFMLENGLTIYLKMTPSDLITRLSDSAGKRPLIKDLNQVQLLSFIEEKLASRRSSYERSEITVDGNNPDLSLILKVVKSSLNI
jgi:shikimate kinase